MDRRHENSGRKPYTEAKMGSRYNLIKARLEAGMSQKQVAEQIGCDQSQYSLIESNKRCGRQYWKKLSILFSIDADELMQVFYDKEFEEFIGG